MKKYSWLLLIVFATGNRLQAQVKYPFATDTMRLSIENQSVRMVYMDVKARQPNGQTVLLLHGKNFNGYYWKDVIPFFTQLGYRVIAPDLIGWGRSDKPAIHYSFHLLALTNKLLLDSLNIQKVIVVAHSMGGMLGIRFSLMYPDRTSRLILENPIGLEDYKTFVPYRTIEDLYKTEKKATYESYKKYQQSYYPVWKPDYEQYVRAQAEILNSPQFDQAAWANAITYQMIYEQPVVYETDRLELPVLLIIGQADRTIVGKDQLTEEQKNTHGQYPQLGKQMKQKLKNCTLTELPGVGHIPHIQDLPAFEKTVGDFLRKE